MDGSRQIVLFNETNLMSSQRTETVHYFVNQQSSIFPFTETDLNEAIDAVETESIWIK